MTVLSLHTWLNPGWLPESVGYYIHQNSVYITGKIVNNTEYTQPGAINKSPPTRVIAERLPLAIRPKVATTLILPCAVRQTEDARNPLFRFAYSYTSTIYPSGLWLLNNIPWFALTPPTGFPYMRRVEGVGETFEEKQQYEEPLFIGLVLGNAHWPRGPGGDAYATTPVEPFAEDYTGSPGFVQHNTRVHLSGMLTRTSDDKPPRGGSILFSPTPVADSGRNLIQPEEGNDWTTCVGPGGRLVPLWVGSVIGEDADLLVPPTDSPPLSLSSGDGGMYQGNNFRLGGTGWQPNFLTTRQGERWPVKIKRTISTFICREGKESNECKGLTGPPSFTFGMAEFLNEVWPQPDWYVMMMKTGETALGIGPHFVEGASGCEGAICKTRFVSSTGKDAADPVLAGGEWWEPEPLPLGGPFTNRYKIIRPPVALYKGDPHVSPCFPFGYAKPAPEYATKDAAPFLWHKTQSPPTLTVSWPGLEANEFEMGCRARLVPLWERRQWGLFAGDTLDLTITGYPGRYPRARIDIGASREAVILRPRD